MSTTVTVAFNRFMQDTVDLPAAVTRSARSRRDYLSDSLTRLAKADPDFTFLKGDFVPYGSFTRRTKIQPLDDIDLLVVVSDRGIREAVTRNVPIVHRVKIENAKAPLARFASEEGYVNSILVLNRVKTALGKLHHYKRAAVKRNYQAVSLSLTSHDWTFDLVPAVPVKTPQGKVKYFLIPDGSGQWMRTDPRKDADLVTKTNARQNQKLLPVIRMLKVWNRRTSKPRLASFLFEVYVLRSFSTVPAMESAPQAVAQFFRECPTLLNGPCPSPAGLGTDLDADLSADKRGRVIAAMHVVAKISQEALRHEQKGEQAQAIACWRKVFGERFPAHG